jgi:hypothetical protein
MAWTAAEVAALKSAIARGEKVVLFSDRSVTYRSLDEMLRALALMEQSIASPARPRQALAYSPDR